MKRICWCLSLCFCSLTCSGCATVGGAVVEGLVDATFNAIFDSDDEDDDDCEIDPYILKRKGIEPGSKAHRRLEAHDKIQREWQEREADQAYQKRQEERRRMEELKVYREFNAGLNETIKNMSANANTPSSDYQ